LRAHSVERFVHAKSFRLAYPVVRVDEKRSHQLVLALALFPYRATVRSSLANGPAHLAMLSLARAISSLGPPCFETRAHLLRGRHFASYNPRPFRRSGTFVLRAEHDDHLLGDRAAPYCGSPQPFQLPGVDTIKTKRSPCGSRRAPLVLTSTCSPKTPQNLSASPCLARTRLGIHTRVPMISFRRPPRSHVFTSQLFAITVFAAFAIVCIVVRARGRLRSSFERPRLLRAQDLSRDLPLGAPRTFAL
jgi:hypothetical protein